MFGFLVLTPPFAQSCLPAFVRPRLYKMVIHWGGAFAVVGGIAAWQVRNAETPEQARERLEKYNSKAIEASRANKVALQDFLHKQQSKDPELEERMSRVLRGGKKSQREVANDNRRHMEEYAAAQSQQK